MGQQIIRQPDGRLAVFDSVSEAFVYVDGTPDEIVEWRAQEAADRARERTRAELDRITATRAPYHQHTLTWDEAAEKDRRSS